MRAIVASMLILLAVCSAAHSDSRPRAWCGWWMRHQMPADPGPVYNQARQWARYGAAAAGPAIGAIVVWPHHVGMIAGRAINGMWLVHSGNDGHAVRTRARSLSGAIAFRVPSSSPILPTFAAVSPAAPSVTRENYT